MWGRGRGWKRYPGFGPWSHLPPWERPGWKFGRGWCWWYLSQYPGQYPYESLSKEDEIRMLEEEAKFLEERLEEIKRRLEELKG